MVKRSAEKEWHWRKLMEQQRRSGQSTRAFCRQRRIPETLFYAWRRELRLRDHERQVLHEKSEPNTKRQQGSFVPVHVVPESQPSIEILLQGKERIAVAPGFDAATLARVLSVLEDRRC